MDFNFYIVLLRLIHIGTGVFWAGSIFYLAMFIGPAVKAIPEGGKFMQQLSNTNKFPIVMMVVVTLNILSGVALVDKMSGHFQGAWFSSTFGMTLSIGGGAAIIAYAVGLTVNMPTVKKIAAIGKEVAAAGGPPSPDKIQQLTALRNKLMGATNTVAWLLGIAVACMAVGRYI